MSRKEDLPMTSENHWKKLFRPIWTNRRTSRVLGLSLEEVEARVASRTLIGLTTKNKRVIFPQGQFMREGKKWQPIPDLDKVWQELNAAREQVDEWTLASMVFSPHEALGRKNFPRYLLEGNDPQPAIELARAEALRHRR